MWPAPEGTQGQTSNTSCSLLSLGLEELGLPLPVQQGPWQPAPSPPALRTVPAPSPRPHTDVSAETNPSMAAFPPGLDFSLGFSKLLGWGLGGSLPSLTSEVLAQIFRPNTVLGSAFGHRSSYVVWELLSVVRAQRLADCDNKHASFHGSV